MGTLKQHLDWWFKDLHVRKGSYVIGTAPNRWLIIFTISIILALMSYKGFFQFVCTLVAYLSLIVWGILEARSGQSRFRKLLGYMALAAVLGALFLRLGLTGV